MARKTPPETGERFANLIVQHATDSMVFTDPDGLTVWANAPFTLMSGYELSEVVGKKPGAVLQGPDTEPETVAKIRTAIRARRTIRVEILNYSKSGKPYWIDLTITPIFDATGTLTHFMSVERDISDSKELIRKTETALSAEQERQRERKVLSQMSEWLFSAQTMAELQSVVTRSMSRLFPDTNGELFIYSNSRDVLDRVSFWGTPQRQTTMHADECWGLRRGRAYGFGTSEIDFACDHVGTDDHPYFCLPIIAHGDTIGLLHILFPNLLAVRGNSEAMNRRLAPALDMAQICAEQISLAAANVRLQTELEDKSVKDVLTDLWNRRWFLDMASREIRRATASDTNMSLILLDVDHFKKFNDAHGHDAGDTVLKVLAAHMSDLGDAFEGVFPCRIGGEEFAILCSRATASDAKEVAEELRRRLSKAQIIYSGAPLPGVTVSAGVTQLAPGEDLQAIMKLADDALYKAKAEGRDQVIVAQRHRSVGQSKTAGAQG